MAGPGDDMAAGAGGRGRLRASDADREQVIEVLKVAFAQGRLDRNEFDLRVGQALASRTYADLATLTADIPAPLTRARPPGPARRSVNKKKKTAAAAAGATIAFVGLMAALQAMPDNMPLPVLLPVFVVTLVLLAGVPTGWLLLLHEWLEERAGRKSAQGLPPGTGGPAARRRAPADPAGQLPRADRGPGHAAEAAPIRRSGPALARWRTASRRRPLGRQYAAGYPGF